MPSDSSPRSVLLVHSDAESWVQDRSFRDHVTPTDSARTARAYLAGTPFDLVLIGPEVEGGEAIGALRDVLGLSTVIERVADVSEVVARLSGDVAPSSSKSASPSASVGDPATSASRPPGSVGDEPSGLDRVAEELARVAHDLNNPLAVIAGNAQLALELAGALGTDESIVESLRAIDGAASALEVLFAQVAALREVVDREREKSRSA